MFPRNSWGLTPWATEMVLVGSQVMFLQVLLWASGLWGFNTSIQTSSWIFVIRFLWFCVGDYFYQGVISPLLLFFLMEKFSLGPQGTVCHLGNVE